MECPNCKNTGNFMRRLFARKKHSKNKVCIFCGAEIEMIYNWKKIGLLFLVIVAVLIMLHYALLYFGYPGVSGGMAGAIVGVTLSLLMRKPPYLTMRVVDSKNKKNNKNTKKKD